MHLRDEKLLEFGQIRLRADLRRRVAALIAATRKRNHRAVWGGRPYRKLLDRLEEEEELRNLAVGEFAHRLKNKIATIQSVISLQTSR